MQIQINTDKNIENSERLTAFFSSEINTELERFDNLITRVEVHFGDENSDKFGKNDKKCLIEVRVAKKEPIAVTDHSDSIEKAFHNALKKVKRVLDNTHEKMRENH
ncbi:HPF/RaiA family ribosome-associated protein [uncultured Flavobacterium sp.]|uniref:HPF/RaiA family ribosome-associated protein n=1 Tax=uncultured Flavobacterium sp. TaxID=165435 RepID=UPI0030EBE582